MLVSEASPAAALGSGQLLTLLLIGAAVLLWPLYRRVIRGVGTAFVLFGLLLVAVALAGGSQTRQRSLVSCSVAQPFESSAGCAPSSTCSDAGGRRRVICSRWHPTERSFDASAERAQELSDAHVASRATDDPLPTHSEAEVRAFVEGVRAARQSVA